MISKISHLCVPTSACIESIIAARRATPFDDTPPTAKLSVGQVTGNKLFLRSGPIGGFKFDGMVRYRYMYMHPEKKLEFGVERHTTILPNLIPRHISGYMVSCSL